MAKDLNLEPWGTRIDLIKGLDCTPFKSTT